MSSLIIEDGSGVIGANSYISEAQALAWASARGFTLPSDDATLDPLIILACDYLESLSEFYYGTPVNPMQALSWPRNCVLIAPNMTYFPNNVIPQALMNAQCQLCIEQFINGISLLPSTQAWQQSGGFVIEERVDVISTRYSERINTSGMPLMPAVDSQLEGLCSNLANGGYLVNVRL